MAGMGAPPFLLAGVAHSRPVLSAHTNRASTVSAGNRPGERQKAGVRRPMLQVSGGGIDRDSPLSAEATPVGFSMTSAPAG
jgi:hypothetical protein